MANSRNKGKRGEREVAKLPRELGVEARRGVQYSGGADSPDVVSELERVHFEVKRVEALRLYAALDQAEADAPEGSDAVVVHRKNGRPWVGILRFGALVELLKAAGRTSAPKCLMCGR